MLQIGIDQYGLFDQYLYGMRTVDQILSQIHQHRTLSRVQLYRYFKVLNIEPLAARQRPQRYPENTAALILDHLGLVPGAGCGRPNCGRIASIKELRSERAKRGAK